MLHYCRDGAAGDMTETVCESERLSRLLTLRIRLGSAILDRWWGLRQGYYGVGQSARHFLFEVRTE